MEPKGLSVMLGAVNINPDINGFVRDLRLPFAVGSCDDKAARLYMGYSDIQLVYVPWLSLIDRKSMIRFQYSGGDKEFLSDNDVLQEKNFRTVLTPLLEEKASVPKKAPAKK